MGNSSSGGLWGFVSDFLPSGPQAVEIVVVIIGLFFVYELINKGTDRLLDGL